jgi:hypothetical protein
MYRIGGFTGAPEDGKVNFFMFAGAGLALDRYLAGDFSSDTNSMLAGKPYLVRPLFGLGCGLMFERVTINILELRLTYASSISLRRIPGLPELECHGESSHWPGAVSLYSGIACNF